MFRGLGCLVTRLLAGLAFVVGAVSFRYVLVVVGTGSGVVATLWLVCAWHFVVFAASADCSLVLGALEPVRVPTVDCWSVDSCCLR